jgi:moderate conductance mechanosensitive channel
VVNVFPASTFGLNGWPAKLVLIAITVVAAGGAFAVLRWLVPKLVSRVGPGTDPTKSRQRYTAAALLSTMLRYLVLVAAVIAIVVILAGGGGVGALGGSAILAIMVGFASQRLLADMIAGFFILFEGQYAVGDVVQLEPTGYVGVVEEVGVRTTILRDADGDRCYVPNGQITAVRRYPSARTMLSVTLLTRDPEAAELALSQIGDLASSGAGGVANALSLVRKEVSGGMFAVHGRVPAATTRAESARDLVAAILKARLGEALSADPVVSSVEAREAERPESVIEV